MHNNNNNNNCGAQQYFGPAPFIRWGPKAQAEEGYGPDAVIQVQHSVGIQVGYNRGRFSPRPVQSLLGRKGKNGIETIWKKSKISVPIEKGVLERVNDQGKLHLLPFNTLHMTESYSPAFSTTPNHSGYGLMGQVSVLEC